MTSSLKDKIVVVTGASKGIGKGIARVFSKLGSKVLLVARGSEEGERAAARYGSLAALRPSRPVM